ncbi:MAG: peptidase T [Spirochaetaceae bacterium]|nr:peptidase T [Spirochaetaceae bacterium]
MKQIEEKVLERFLRYVRVWTTSDPRLADDGVMPSSEGQKEFAEILRKELTVIGVADITVTEHGYVLARIPASPGCEGMPSLCLLAHLDTSSEVSGKDISPILHKNYDGSPILLKDGVVIDPASDRELRNCIGETIITSDGTTLLGADDKAGIAIIMTAAELLCAARTGNATASGEAIASRHGSLEIIFSPDEETGHGMDRVPLEWLRSKAAYTIDGGDIGEIESECFNAWKADITFTGVSRHLGTARPDMVNAVTMAASFISLLPRTESPETTDGWQGYYCPLEITGSVETANLTLFLRDFSLQGMERRLAAVEDFAQSIRTAFPGGEVTVKTAKQYLNMKEKMDEHPEVMEQLIQAVKNAGIEPKFKPIRGGTDGSRLTELGIPTPNIFTGGHNFHSRTEWASLSQMAAAVRTVMELVTREKREGRR